MATFWTENNQRISIKNKDELKLMRKSGEILGFVLSEVEKYIKPGQSTWEIDQFAENLILQKGGNTVFKGYHGFPATTCICVNEEVVHGIPKKEKIIKEGDIITVDCGVNYKGFITDSAITVGVGKINYQLEKIINTAYKALEKGIQIAKPGIRTTEISKAIEAVIRKEEYGIVEDLSGHGVGIELHEDPYILNYYDGEPGPLIKEGMTFAIEPIITLGNNKTKTLSDKWTIVTKDGFPAVQVEHTIAITSNGAEILTIRPK